VCDVPVFPHAYLTDGIRAVDPAALDAEWGLVSWEVFLDGQAIDLTTFSTYDRDVTVGTRTLKTRNWLIELDNLAPGKHTYRSIFSASQAVSDPINGKLAAGRYTYEAQLNIGIENYARACPKLPAATSAATAAANQVTTTGGPAYAGFAAVPSSCGALIDKVIAGGPAAKANLKAGDLILTVNAIPVTTLPGMSPVLLGSTAGQTVIYSVARGKAVMEVTLTFAEVPSAATPEAAATQQP